MSAPSETDASHPPDPAFVLDSRPEWLVLEPRFAALKDRLIGRRISAVYLLQGSCVGLVLDDCRVLVLDPSQGREIAEDVG